MKKVIELHEHELSRLQDEKDALNMTIGQNQSKMQQIE
jgi:hypothetical protein